jgi:hypothetical protein
MQPFDWDVFLSHSSIDKPRVARLAERLTAAGFRVWFDRANMDSGEDIVVAIEQGLERSRMLVLCITKAAFESEWVRLKRNTATLRDPANHDRRFLPLRLDDCQIPATLRRLKCIDRRTESFSRLFRHPAAQMLGLSVSGQAAIVDCLDGTNFENQNP